MEKCSYNNTQTFYSTSCLKTAVYQFTLTEKSKERIQELIEDTAIRQANLTNPSTEKIFELVEQTNILVPSKIDKLFSCENHRKAILNKLLEPLALQTKKKNTQQKQKKCDIIKTRKKRK